MLEVKPLSPDQWPLLKAIRLKALADAPEAFSTTLSQAQAWSDREWQQRAQRFTAHPPATACIASLDGNACGMISCYLAEADSHADGSVAELTAFWVDPERRGEGVGEALIACIIDWATAHEIAVLQAWVTASNNRAIAFYSKVGFRATGLQQPYEPEPSEQTILLARKLELPAVSQGTGN